MAIQHRLAANVKAYRRKLNWSQEDLADASGLHRTYVSGVERAIRNPTIEIIQKLAKALKVTPSKLLE